MYRNDTLEVCLPLPKIIILFFLTCSCNFHFHSTFEDNEADIVDYLQFWTSAQCLPLKA